MHFSPSSTRPASSETAPPIVPGCARALLRRRHTGRMAAFSGNFASNTYAKMLVSRKNLSFIHLVPGKGTVGADVFQSTHERVYGRTSASLCRVLFQPRSEGRIQRGFAQPRNLASSLNDVLVRAQGDSLHTCTLLHILRTLLHFLRNFWEGRKVLREAFEQAYRNLRALGAIVDRDLVRLAWRVALP